LLQGPLPTQFLVFLFFLPLLLLLLFLLSLLFPYGEGSLRKTGKEAPAPPARAADRSGQGGRCGPGSGLAVCREQAEETGLPGGGGGWWPSRREAVLPGVGGPTRVWLRLWTGAGVLLQDGTVSAEGPGLEAGPRPNFWSQLCH